MNSRTAKPKYKVHMLRRYERCGGIVTTTLCGRKSDVAVDTDDKNVTANREAITCSYCTRLLAAMDKRAAREVQR